ncbi:hypothetical protein ACFJGW_04125 [Burkholderiaceae bacterium UC74_6]
MRRHLLITLLAGTAALTAHAQFPMGNPKEAIVAGANATGQTWQFASRCGTSADLLKQYRARFDAETQEGRGKLYPSLGIDIDAEFKKGQDVGNQFYDSVQSAADRGRICKQTTELIQSILASKK